MPTRSLRMYVSRWEVNDVIALYFILAAAAFALGYWQGYIVAERKYKKELMNRKVEVKLIRPKKFVPVCVTEKISHMDLVCGDMDIQGLLDEHMNHELMKEIKPYIVTESTHENRTDSLVVRKSLVVIQPEEWANHE